MLVRAAYSFAEQTIKLPLGNAVTFARTVHQATAIDDRDIATRVADEAGPLQGACRSRHASPLHPQHHRQELLSEQKLIRMHAVVRHQEPAATSLLQGMKLIAGGRLRDLIEKGVSIAKHHRLHRSASR